ncbi:MAG: folylpolyglutamate synthase/dihydrofolate synthase family protein [Planctomycetota bacterium]
MNYEEATAYLDGFVNLERSALDRQARAAITLESVRELAHRLGDPHLRVPAIHVAGTKGKGSTCAFAASILRAHGLRVGLYVSPHLEDVRERVSIDGRLIPESDFARILTGCVPVLESMRHPAPNRRRPTYFEILTHLAFTWFAEQKVDAALIEVGLGGRLDATTIVEPIVCGIANISYDHMAILGDTLDLIAREKAGIFKSGIPAVIAPQQPEAENALRAVALHIGSPIEGVGRDSQVVELPSQSQDEWPNTRAQARMPDGTEYTATLALKGRHQIENWALALRLSAIFYQKRLNKKLSADAVERGSRDVVWPGRLERIKAHGQTNGPTIFVDGAHNAASVEAILNDVHEHLKRKPLVCVFGCARDKDIAGMIRILSRAERGVDQIIFTDSGNPRGCMPTELADAWKNVSTTPCDVRESSAEGLALAIKLAGPNGAVIVTGSLYLVGNVKRQMRSENGSRT